MDFKYSLDFFVQKKAEIEHDLDELSLEIDQIDNNGRGWCHPATQATARDKIIPIENEMRTLQRELDSINANIKKTRRY